MIIENRIDKIERRLASGEVDLIFVITTEGCTPQTARIDGEKFWRQEGETPHDLADRAVRQYRMQHKPVDNVSVLVMDCRPERPWRGCAAGSWPRKDIKGPIQ